MFGIMVLSYNSFVYLFFLSAHASLTVLTDQVNWDIMIISATTMC